MYINNDTRSHLDRRTDTNRHTWFIDDNDNITRQAWLSTARSISDTNSLIRIKCQWVYIQTGRLYFNTLMSILTVFLRKDKLVHNWEMKGLSISRYLSSIVCFGDCDVISVSHLWVSRMVADGHSVSNYRQLDCLFNHWFRLTTKDTPKHRTTDRFLGESTTPPGESTSDRWIPL